MRFYVISPIYLLTIMVQCPQLCLRENKKATGWEGRLMLEERSGKSTGVPVRSTTFYGKRAPIHEAEAKNEILTNKKPIVSLTL